MAMVTMMMTITVSKPTANIVICFTDHHHQMVLFSVQPHLSELPYEWEALAAVAAGWAESGRWNEEVPVPILDTIVRL